MYGLPANLDLSFLLKQSLMQLAIGQNEVIFNFDGGASIIVQSRIVIRRSGSSVEGDDYGVFATSLAEFLGCSIESCLTESQDRLAIGFGSEGEIVLCDDSKQFESFIIKQHADTRIVV